MRNYTLLALVAGADQPITTLLIVAPLPGEPARST